MSLYDLTCLICGEKSHDLVAIQEHVMDEHGYTQDDHRKVSKRLNENRDGWIFTMPDGVDWLDARRG